jgi:hypothetical protein
MAKTPRSKLPDSSFALRKQRKYRIDTIGRARNAQARAAQNATPAQQRTIAAAAKKRWPSIRVTAPARGGGRRPLGKR